MDIENASNILAGSILTGLALIVAVITIVIINNILSKYWKPIRIFSEDSFAHYNNNPKRFASPEELNHAPDKKDPQ